MTMLKLHTGGPVESVKVSPVQSSPVQSTDYRLPVEVTISERY